MNVLPTRAAICGALSAAGLGGIAVPASAQSQLVLDPFTPVMLYSHNVERSAVGLPPLVWDPQLAAAAKTYANELAATGVIRHSSWESRVGQGENLWAGTRGAFTPAFMVGTWAAEKALFRPGIFPNVAVNGNSASVGHYTQMIWPSTRRVGCAISSSSGFDFLACRYSPAGNVIGQRVP